MTLYSEAFYADRRAMTLESARTILSLVAQEHPFASVVDLGCGTGTWLEVALSLGAKRAVGFEGPWVEPAMLDTPEIELHTQVLEEPVELGERFDLAISLEVAEHLTPGRAASFVADLCRLSETVLFAAAIPGQRGVGHINERWQSYWAGCFAAQGYGCVDVIRPAVWQQEGVAPWYRQNTFLFIKGAKSSATVLDLVHPHFWLRNMRMLKEQARKKD